MNMLKIDKKNIIFSLLLFILIIIIPMVQFLLLTQSNTLNGKIEVNKTIKAPFLKEFKKETIIMFFGYVGCTDVCIPLLNQIKTMYEEKGFKKFYSYTDIVFVNLIPGINPEAPTKFAQTFNENFKGIYLKQDQLMTIERNFKLFFSQNIFNKTKLNHTDYIYLLKRQPNEQLILENIYTSHPFKAPDLINDLIQLKNKAMVYD